MFAKAFYKGLCSIAIRAELILCLLALLFFSATISSKERTFRVFDQSNGLPVSSISGFAQDANGFFWFGTAAGLFRFDGTDFRQWAKGKLAGWHYQVYAAPDGEVFVFDLTHTLYRVLPNEDAEPVNGPDGQPFTNMQDAAFTGTGRFGSPGMMRSFIAMDRASGMQSQPRFRVTKRFGN